MGYPGENSNDQNVDGNAHSEGQTHKVSEGGNYSIKNCARGHLCYILVKT